MKPIITHAELIANYKYTPETGIFFNKKTDKRIGFYDKSCNKRKINIGDRNYAESRLAVFYVTGKWPVGFVKSTSKRKQYNTKLRDLVYVTDDYNVPAVNKLTYDYPDLDSCRKRILQSRNNFEKKIEIPKTLFQRFLSMFQRI